MTITRIPATPDTLNGLVEFDAPFMVRPDGTIDTHLPGIWAPEVYWDDDGPEISSREPWAPVNGYSGQDRYAGPVMHASEYLGGGMARDVLAAPGIYVLVVVTCLPDDDDPEPEPAGWMLIRHGDR